MLVCFQSADSAFIGNEKGGIADIEEIQVTNDTTDATTGNVTQQPLAAVGKWN